MPEKFYEKARRIEKNPDYTFRHFEKKKTEQYAEDIMNIYNEAWVKHQHHKGITKQMALNMVKQMKPVMDEKIIWFAYYQQAPIAMFINIPDLNQWFRHLKGKFNLWHKLYFLWIKLTRPNKKFTGLVFGIIPEFQGKGIDAYIIGESAKVLQSNKMPYTEYEMQWIGDFNPKMLNIAQNLGEVSITRKLATFRYLFDPTLPFKRHPIL